MSTAADPMDVEVSEVKGVWLFVRGCVHRACTRARASGSAERGCSGTAIAA